MRKEKREQLTRQLTKSLELPVLQQQPDLILPVFQNPFIIFNGQIPSSGHGNYGCPKHQISGQFEITGRNLKIDYYTNDDMKITGQVDKLEYGM